jgi:hypothetical protein
MAMMKNGYATSEFDRKMQLATVLLKDKGWVFHMFSFNSVFRGLEMAEWCHKTFGNQYGNMDPKTWDDYGRWIAFEMKFATPELKQYCIGFENEKMMLMWKMNFGDAITDYANS